MSSSLASSLITSFPSTNTQRAIKTRTNPTHGFRVSCNAAPNDHNDSQKLVLPSVDRRNLLVGLGGLYTAANLTSLPEATAEPITTPDITSSSCKREVTSSIKDGAIRPRECCPPNLGKTVQDFKFPTENTVRMRWPAHKGTDKQVENYRKAIQAMRELPDNHPHSFNNQAKIHCAYCHGGYTQVDKDGNKTDIQVHNSWLFFPFHRLYLYFYERILGKLIDDPTFALPYWKWDDPEGMKIPDIFVPEYIKDIKNPLYDEYREAAHLPPAMVDLNFHGKEESFSNERQIACNLSAVYRELVRTEGDPLSFFGGKYVAGSAPVPNGDKSVSTVERGSHTAVHRWVGDSKLANHEDMGSRNYTYCPYWLPNHHAFGPEMDILF
ncbi:hypothetical protein M8C21_009466 [Ambrosia artemisiifolia]|uniref:Tyrosinase copper-binding domain-containing protein n=1 Tax=Ambrosia artemisiifolia TaxID=4212 RepID=A0AAD5GWD6_AMBAR|nr:hypothetical protein M8C21_009466 [Ambrosia artemisiifolia]